MLAILKNRTYRHLFAAQVIALLGTGLMTVALGLLAYDLAGADAGAVLGTALAIKMIAYVGVAPVAQAFTDRLPRRSLLVGLDLIRGAVALCLPFVTEIWQIYLLIFVLQAASAAFTPTFQATIPDILHRPVFEDDQDNAPGHDIPCSPGHCPCHPPTLRGTESHVRGSGRWREHADIRDWP